MKKTGYLKYKSAPVKPEEREEYDAHIIKAREVSRGMTNEEWLKNQERLQQINKA